MWRSHPGQLNGEENGHLGRIINECGGEALLDERVKWGGSHHQKLFVVRHQGRPEDDVAFVGGIDLCYSRRDDAEHGGDPQAAPLDDRYGDAPPWHDAMAEIRGPAVAHVLDTFTERWDDATPLDHRNPYRAVAHRVARMPRRAEQLPERWDPPPEAGRHQVQVLRTYPWKRPHYPFAPDGERSIARAYTRAFARARRMIYVEDQYFWSDVVAGTLAEALRREPDLQVIAVVPRCREDESRFGGPPAHYGQRVAYDLLRDGGRRPVQHVRPRERRRYADLRPRQGLHRRRRVDDHRLRQPQPPLVDPRLRAHLRGRRPRRRAAALGCVRRCGPSTSACPRTTPGWPTSATRRPSGTSGSARRAAACTRHEPARVSARTARWAAPLYRRFYDPDGRPKRLRGTSEF